jgi:hypothetical protein
VLRSDGIGDGEDNNRRKEYDSSFFASRYWREVRALHDGRLRRRPFGRGDFGDGDGDSCVF